MIVTLLSLLEVYSNSKLGCIWQCNISYGISKIILTILSLMETTSLTKYMKSKYIYTNFNYYD